MKKIKKKSIAQQQFDIRSKEPNMPTIFKHIFLALLFVLLLPSQAFAQQGYGLSMEYSSNISQPVLGDRINVTARVYKAGQPFTEDLSASLLIKNKKNGQSCELTDDTTDGDGKMEFFCESTQEAGGIEVELEPDSDYYSFNYTFKTDYYDPQKFCSPLPQPPKLNSITPQNDITADVHWTQSEPFAGSFTIVYGTAPDNLSNRNNHTNLSHTQTVISGLNPQNTYYVQVQSNTCGTQLKSQLYSYQPGTGAFSVYTGSSSKPSPSPTSTKKPENQPTKPSPSATANSITAAESSASAEDVQDEPSPSPTPLPELDATSAETNNPIALIILGVLAAVGLSAAAGFWFKRKNAETDDPNVSASLQKQESDQTLDSVAKDEPENI